MVCGDLNGYLGELVANLWVHRAVNMERFSLRFIFYEISSPSQPNCCPHMDTNNDKEGTICVKW